MNEEEIIDELMKIKDVGEKTAMSLKNLRFKGPSCFKGLTVDQILVMVKGKKSGLGRVSFEKIIKSVNVDRDHEYTIADDRYKAIKERSFKDMLKLRFFMNHDFKSEEIVSDISFDTRDRYLAICKNMKKIRDENKELKDIDPKRRKECRKLYADKFENDFRLSEFREKYKEDKSQSRKCEYCGISETQIKELIYKEGITTKRLINRGHTMEADRREPNDKYEFGNVAICCYWCNNAKSDEFSVDEFKPIGRVICAIWNMKLKSIHSANLIPTDATSDKFLDEITASAKKYFDLSISPPSKD